MWLVVEFTEERDTAVIPDCWTKGGTAWWPPYKSMTRIMAAVKQKEVPGAAWDSHQYIELYRSGNIFFLKLFY